MFSALQPNSDIAQSGWHVSKGPILLKKSFVARISVFQRLPVRLTPLDAGDHVNLRKIAQRSSETCGEGLYCQSSPRADVSKIFAVALLSTFSTESAMNGLMHRGKEHRFSITS
jgi:hypothetical protein